MKRRLDDWGTDMPPHFMPHFETNRLCDSLRDLLIARGVQVSPVDEERSVGILGQA
jgi:hypothetical protein